MMSKQEITFQIIDDKVKVTTPYNADFVAKCRNFRGKWEPKEKAWYFDDTLIDHVRETLMEFFGTTGEVPYENCTLQVDNFDASCMTGPVILFGRIIAKAFGRDSGAKLGDDIVLLSGTIDSSGSVKNWSTIVNKATLHIKNFPLPGTELPEVKAAIEEGWVKVIRSTKKRPEAEIRAEIAALLARVDELQKELDS